MYTLFPDAESKHQNGMITILGLLMLNANFSPLKVFALPPYNKPLRLSSKCFFVYNAFLCKIGFKTEHRKTIFKSLVVRGKPENGNLGWAQPGKLRNVASVNKQRFSKPPKTRARLLVTNHMSEDVWSGCYWAGYWLAFSLVCPGSDYFRRIRCVMDRDDYYKIDTEELAMSSNNEDQIIHPWYSKVKKLLGAIGATFVMPTFESRGIPVPTNQLGGNLAEEIRATFETGIQELAAENSETSSAETNEGDNASGSVYEDEGEDDERDNRRSRKRKRKMNQSK